MTVALTKNKHFLLHSGLLFTHKQRFKSLKLCFLKTLFKVQIFHNVFCTLLCVCKTESLEYYYYFFKGRGKYLFLKVKICTCVVKA